MSDSTSDVTFKEKLICLMEHGAGQLKLSVPPLFLENHANPAFAYFTNYIKNNVLDEYNVAHFLLIARLYFSDLWLALRK